MSGDTILFLSIRVLHVVLAGIWLGAVFFATIFLSPAMQKIGPAAGQVMSALVRRGMPAIMASIGGMTILTGIYLFWRFTGGFDPEVSASRAGIAFSIGALAGVIALIMGGIMIGRSAKRAAALAERMAAMSEGAERAAIVNEMNALRARMRTAGPIVLALLIVAMAAMALGHYV
jgi:uncharacterized membrane protein